jgi:hypothetical protein
MRHPLLILVLAALPTLVWAGEITGTDEIPSPPPAYQMLRFF